MDPARKFSCLSIPRSCIVAQSNPGGRPATLIILCVCCACAELAVSPENVPRLISATKTPARTTNSPIKTRRLKKADREADFFFMNGYDVNGISVWSVVVAELPLPRQHFFQFVGCPRVLFGTQTPDKLFFRFFDAPPRGLDEFLAVEEGNGSDANGDIG